MRSIVGFVAISIAVAIAVVIVCMVCSIISKDLIQFFSTGLFVQNATLLFGSSI